MPVEQDLETPMDKVRKPLRCKYCPISFCNLDSYRQHTIKHKRRHQTCLQIKHKTHLMPLVKDDICISDDDEQIEILDQCTDGDRTLRVRKDVSDRYCTPCQVLFPGKQELWDHVRTDHSVFEFNQDAIKSLTCPRCSKSFVYNRSDLSKSGSKTGKRRYSCPYCKVYFTRKTDGNGGEVNEVLSKVFDCPECNRAYRHKYKLPLQDDNNEEQGQCCPKHVLKNCPVCKKKFKKLHNYKYHMHTVHGYMESKPKNKNLTCKTCDKSFKKKYYLVKHISRGKCMEMRVTPFYCEICNKYFKMKRYLSDHYRKVHTKRAVKCSLCKKMFQDKESLSEHCRKMHQKEMEYVKDEKDHPKKVNNNTAIVKPVDGNDMIHASLQCQLCPKYFKEKRYLVEHYRKLHKVDNHWVYTKYSKQSPEQPKSPKQSQELIKIDQKSKKVKKMKKRHKSKHVKKEHKSPVQDNDGQVTPLPTTREVPGSIPDTHVEGGEELHQCELCPARYDSRKGMLQHMRRKHHISQRATPLTTYYTCIKGWTKDYKCHLCRQTFVVEESLKQHILLFHDDAASEGAACASGQFKCGYCLLAFTDRNQLSRHMIGNHVGEDM